LKTAALLLALVAAAMTPAGCGYHVAGTANMLPASVHTIAIPPWTSIGVQYRLPNLLTQAITREMISRTHYTIVADPAKADAVLNGAVANMFSQATIGDPATGRTTGGQVIVHIQVRLTDKSGKVLFNRPDFEYRERYEITVDPGQYFDENQPALERLSRDAARSVVSAILENF
jgi:outer membrane lipopolysaccharide assembly protein LptE/RlpB